MPDLELEPELENLLRFPSAARRIQGDVRARVLRRALLTGGPMIAPAPSIEGPTSSTIPRSPGRVLGRLALAASIALVAGAAGALAALYSRPAAIPPAAWRPGGQVSSARPIDDGTTAAPPVIAATADAPRRVTARIRRAARAGGVDALAEVELLQRAQLAYARRDFSDALALVQEHARRFPRGPLAEECEALRVESLVGAGRADEARRASRAFAARFPRSVLLSHIEAASDARERARLPTIP